MKDGWVLVLLPVCALLLFGTLSRGHEWGDDWAGYTLQAKAIREGKLAEEVATNRYTVENSSHPLGPAAYPWGFPLLLAPLYGENILALKIPGALCLIAFLALLAFGFRRYHSGWWLFALVGLFALNPVVLSAADEVLSDIPFLLLSTAAVLLIGKSSGLSLGALMAAACFVRGNGVLLPAVLIVTQIFGCRRRSILPHLTFLALFLLWRAAFPEGGGGSYLSYLRGTSFGTVSQNALDYARAPAHFFAGAPLHKAIYVASVPFTLYGAFLRRREDAHILIYVALTLGLLLVWPFAGGLRLFLPALPFYCSFLLTGLEQVVGDSTRRVRACAACLAFVLCGFVLTSAVGARDNLARGRVLPRGAYTRTAVEMFEFVKERTEPGARIVFFRPRAMRLMTSRRSVFLNSTDGLMPGDYVCLYLLREPAPHQPQSVTGEEVFRNEDFLIVRR